MQRYIIRLKYLNKLCQAAYLKSHLTSAVKAQVINNNDILNPKSNSKERLVYFAIDSG